MVKVIEQDGNKTEYITTLGDPDGKANASLVVGGKAKKFVPNVNISKWSNEAWLNLNHRDTGVTNEIETFADGTVELIVSGLKHRYYMLKDDRLEWEIVFAQEPLTNTITIDLDFPEGLRFLYQAPLTQEQIDGGKIRPDDVAGSYAVYWKKQNNQYRTGKFCHIYRPKVIDKNGDWVWGEVHIDLVSKKLTFTIDSGWLEKAIYPVTLGATQLGFTTKGGSTRGTAADYIYAWDVGADIVGGGLVTKLCVWNFDNAVPARWGLYDESGGDPNLIKDWTAEGTTAGGNEDPGTLQEWNATQSYSILDGGTYFVATWVDTDFVFLYHDDDAAFDNRHNDWTYDGSEDWDSPYNVTADVDNEKTSVYVEYAAVAAARTVPPRAMFQYRQHHMR